MNFTVKAVSVCILLFAQACFADDNPEVDQGAAAYNQMNCVQNATGDCINNLCLTSDDTDCEDNCRTMAEDKCQQAVDE